MAIRAIEAGDRAAWGRLFVDYGIFYETEFDEAVLDGVWEWLMDAAHPVSALVATNGTNLVAFAHLRRLDDTFTAGSGWSLDDLYVIPDERGQGLATTLIEAVASTCSSSGGGTLRWITAASNTTAQRVYDTIAKRTTWVTYELDTDERST